MIPIHILSGGIASASPYYPVGADCVLYHAYWDGTAVDHSLGGNDGNVVTPLFGTYGLTFNGTSDRVWMPAADSLDVGVGDFTIMTFVKVANDVTGRIVASDYGAGLWFHYLYAANGVCVIRWFDENWLGYYTNSVVGAFDGSWKHIAAITDRDVGSRIAVNGAWSGNWDGATTTASIITNRVSFGDIPDNANNPLKFEMGEMLFFNTAKDLTAIQDHYNTCKSRYGL